MQVYPVILYGYQDICVSAFSLVTFKHFVWNDVPKWLVLLNCFHVETGFPYDVLCVKIWLEEFVKVSVDTNTFVLLHDDVSFDNNLKVSKVILFFRAAAWRETILC